MEKAKKKKTIRIKNGEENNRFSLSKIKEKAKTTIKINYWQKMVLCSLHSHNGKRKR